MFVFHLHANRREVSAEANAAAKEAELAHARTRELERLMAFGQALSRALTLDGIHEVIWRYLPPLAGGADVWMLVRAGSEWERVTDRAQTRWGAGEIEAVADRIVSATQPPPETADGIESSGMVCFVIRSGASESGVIGVASPRLSPEIRQTIATAATLVGIALRNVQLFSEVREHGLRDGLTGCFNRAHGLETLEGELARARRSDLPLSVVMFDVDYFKRINDEHGHLCGDEVLTAVGARLRQVLRRSDLRCRFGGDEFLVLLPETAGSGAARVAEWVRGEIEQIEVRGRTGPVRLTASVGVATSTRGEAMDSLLERADAALYAAKAAGRNCVRASSSARPALQLTAAASA